MFQNNDAVIYAGTHRAKIVATLPNGHFRIEFENKSLIPPIMEVPQYSLERTAYGVENGCPKCNVPWKETLGFRFSYFDCPTCGMKKEDACVKKD